MALRRGRTLVMSAGAVVTVAAAVAIVLVLLPGQGGPALVRLSAAPLGVNVAPWDRTDSGYGASVMQPELKAAGIGQLRYGGGSYADSYDWETSTRFRSPARPAAAIRQTRTSCSRCGRSRTS